jgi:hypothetical protein
MSERNLNWPVFVTLPRARELGDVAINVANVTVIAPCRDAPDTWCRIYTRGRSAEGVFIALPAAQAKAHINAAIAASLEQFANATAAAILKVVK